jgi:hypothetical protein
VKNTKRTFSYGSIVSSAIAVLLFVLVGFWWSVLHPFDTEALVDEKYIWGSIYQILALWGAICGIVISVFWGGFKSVLGRSILAFALGLLLQVLGQSVYSYYNLFADVQAPYPSLGDVGFFGSVLMYIYGVFLLARVSGVKVSLRSFRNQISAILIPLVMLALSYFIFLRGYEFDWSQPVRVFLDFAYPFGQAIYVSIAILTLILSRKVLGGIMRKPVLLFVFALIVQFLCDYNFLFQVSRETWFVGGYGDLLYAFSYLLMSLALIYIGNVFKKIKEA